MIVCLCEALSERALRQAVREGCSSRFELAEATGAGRNCGNCRCDLKEIVRSEVESLQIELEGDGLPMAAK